MSDMNYNNCECDQRESCDCDCKCYCECERCRTLAPNRTTLKCGCPGAVTLPLATISRFSNSVRISWFRFRLVLSGRSPASLRLLKVIHSHFSYVTAISAMQNAALTV